MIAVVERNASALAELCRQFRVDRLYLFGSATGERFDSENSDLDFLVSLQDRALTGEYAERFLGLADALERSVSTARGLDHRAIDPKSLLSSRSRIHAPAYLLSEVETLLRDAGEKV